MEAKLDFSKEHKVERIDSESDKVYNQRLNFIEKVYTDKKNFKDAVNLSKIWLNYKYNNCRYQPEVFYKLKKYLD